MGGADDGAGACVAEAADGVGAPLFDEVGHVLVDALAAGEFELLDLCAGWVGGAHEDEQVAVRVLCGGGEGFDAV